MSKMTPRMRSDVGRVSAWMTVRVRPGTGRRGVRRSGGPLSFRPRAEPPITRNIGRSVGDRGQGTGSREQGDRGQGTGDREQETRDRDREQGTGSKGQGTGDGGIQL